MAEKSNPVPGRTIGEHGVIGDLDTAALVATDGTIDFMCWPHLDSPSMFAALLDPDAGGEFVLTPNLIGARAVQLYVPDTNILTTSWLGRDGSAEITDLMTHPDSDVAGPRALIRRVKATRGRVQFALRCRPRFDYARIVPTVHTTDQGVIFRNGDEGMIRLTGSVALVPGDAEATATFDLAVGEEAFFVLSDPKAAALDAAGVACTIMQTRKAWQRWSSRSTYRGRWREEVMRSALALKLLTSRRYGSIAAAATFGLPEATGAGRNWNYRATWIRDASFTVYAFMRLGYVEEAENFRAWMGTGGVGESQASTLRIMYALDGSQAADEVDLGHLAGYGGSKPVRVGNAANRQSQLDIYGELMDSAYLSNKYGSAASHEGWQHVRAMVRHVESHWREADAGIWELRGPGRHLTHSRLMCWVAIDRAIRLANKRSLPAPLADWTALRDQIAENIWANCRHPEHGYFVQEQGGKELDAALLMMPLVRFVSATDPVWLATLDAIGHALVDDAMVYRYRNADGLEGGEGAFTTCTFWYVECLARAGRMDEAQQAMAKGLAYANHLGLFSEELDICARPLGNTPQALTHLSFISAAHFLNRRLDHSGDRQWQP
ncbi:MAG: glycoside hydrolase family 15 protein [Luteimonas sp.]